MAFIDPASYHPEASDFRPLRPPVPAGNTAARDGVLRALRLLQDATIAEMPAAAEPGKVVINYLLAFTDGGDNSSKVSVSSLLEELRHPRLSNFHFMTIAAGLYSKDR